MKYGPAHYLPGYAKLLNTVEVDQWFRSLFPSGVVLPDEDIVQRYAESVPGDFLFTIEAPNAITLTHFYAKQPKAYQAYTTGPTSTS